MTREQVEQIINKMTLSQLEQLKKAIVKIKSVQK